MTMNRQLSRRSFVKGGALAATAIPLVGLTGCGGSSQSSDSSSQVDDSLVMISMVGSSSFNPLGSATTDKPVLHALFDTLYKFDTDGNVYPYLVTSEQEDGLQKTLELRDDAKFSDGNAVTADDVVFSFNKIMEDQTYAAIVPSYVTSVEKVDDNHVLVTAPNAKALWRNFLAENLYVVEAAAWDDGADYTTTQPVGSGPYTLTGVDEAQTVSLSTYDGYWNGTPDFKTVQVKTPVESSTALIALQTGEADYVSQLDEATCANAREDSNLVVTDFDSWSCETLNIFVGDEKFREGIFHAINRQNIIDICYNGTGEPASNIFSRKVMGEFADQVPFTGYDVDLAKQCIAESGTDLSQTYQIACYNHSDVVQCIQQDLSAVGISVEVQELDSNTYFEQTLAGTLQMCIGEFGTDLLNCEGMIDLLYGTGSVYKLPMSDELKGLVATMDEELAAGEDDTATVEQALELIAQEGTLVPLTDVNLHDCYRKGIGNVLDCSAAAYVYYLGDLTIEG